MDRKYTVTRVSDDEPLHLRERARAFRLAFAVVGELIADGFIVVDVTEDGWHERFELMLVDVADQLNSFEC